MFEFPFKNFLKEDKQKHKLKLKTMLQFLKDLFFGKKVEKAVAVAKSTPAPVKEVKVVRDQAVKAEAPKKVSKPRNKTNKGPKKAK